VQFHATGIDVDAARCEFYMGSAYAPGGYVWVFPKGKHEANIGMGMLGNHVLGRPPLKYLSEFMGRFYPEGKVIGVVAGAVPASDLIPRLSAGGLVLVGDAGRLCDPLVGGGIVNGMRSGRIAGDVIAEAIRSRDVSAPALQQYDREIDRTIGNTIRSHYRVKERLLNLNDEHINGLMGYLVPFAPMISTSMVMMELFGTGNPLLGKLIRPVFNYASIAGSMTTNRAPFV
jgi:digeranylgeranylglycerophospholipid reductase